MFGYFADNAQEILGWLAWHTVLSVLPVVIGLVIALPIGVLSNRYRIVYPGVVAATGLLYTIPSLALFVIMPAILGTQILSPVNVVVALTVYSVALLVRVVADGLSSVPADVLQSASAMGYRAPGRLFRVELPIALPVIAAGLRVATVSNVSLVSVAALLGIPQLGQLFTIGFQLDYYPPLVIGIVLCLLLALLLDTLIVTGTWLVTPWRRAAGGSS